MSYDHCEQIIFRHVDSNGGRSDELMEYVGIGKDDPRQSAQIL